ncbi:uncharacterized protein LOC106174514 [Lingula anatina]|uniref:Uncharacterized protein LOC106174514 n=1 Tax=Lingula anatina TaxID=7574 RepID=A0A1S3JMG7_LINAN|nr:uncharacterized protein LOC106174514 [Lingula anatina]XP_013411559.1 uncharacterized protein LOC106174514 [Lingula anatina]XP_013411560.1 uncharacterized protein LOC106174514 [Lingula anatina]XP_013411561.1 uncharacterized protein LOC106174514 [Lingula anatina]XP_013411562.1 uncharacterized protein LOC106174514 [Lingula anatina]XP_013411564.1 uncharacterized protein LOC106174514 [Lingula anatina]XP_013411565.1 uncharacterized protein LOC106174514 [Lingula anatina]XP_013411566.1 uncharacte|eukprot:XP_013411558.1 uncharacterized protein LOC106174514 [Lingula anatina]
MAAEATTSMVNYAIVLNTTVLAPMFSTENDTAMERNKTGFDETALNKWFYPTMAVVTFIGMVFNFVSILALWLIPHKPWRPFHYFLMYLAISDWLLLFICFVGATTATVMFQSAVDFQLSDEQLCAGNTLSDLSCYLIIPPFLATTGLVINQYLSVSHALRYSSMVTNRRALISIILSCVLVVCTYFIMHGIALAQSVTTCDDHYKRYILYREYYLAITTIVLSVVNVAIYIMIYAQARKVSKYGDHCLPAGERSHHDRLTTTIAILLATIILFWTPGTLASIFAIVNHENSDLVFTLLQIITNIMFFLNSISDPLIYGIRLKEVRHGYGILFTKLKKLCNCHKETQDDNGYVLTRMRSVDHGRNGSTCKRLTTSDIVTDDSDEHKKNGEHKTAMVLNETITEPTEETKLTM